MLTVERVEDLRVWQSARQLCSKVYAVSDSSEFALDSALKDQIREAAVSVFTDIAKGSHADSNAEFRHFGRSMS